MFEVVVLFKRYCLYLCFFFFCVCVFLFFGRLFLPLAYDRPTVGTRLLVATNLSCFPLFDLWILLACFGTSGLFLFDLQRNTMLQKKYFQMGVLHALLPCFLFLNSETCISPKKARPKHERTTSEQDMEWVSSSFQTKKQWTNM